MMPVPARQGRRDGEGRQFLRHPADVPIHVTDVPRSRQSRVTNVSHGGIAFTCDRAHPVGSEIEVGVPDVDPDFRVRAVVAWCRRTRSGHRIGARFLDPDAAYQSRMVEQLAAIESYRRRLAREQGRVLSGEEAAREWIGRYGGNYPDPLHADEAPQG